MHTCVSSALPRSLSALAMVLCSTCVFIFMFKLHEEEKGSFDESIIYPSSWHKVIDGVFVMNGYLDDRSLRMTAIVKLALLKLSKRVSHIKIRSHPVVCVCLFDVGNLLRSTHARIRVNADHVWFKYAGAYIDCKATSIRYTNARKTSLRCTSGNVTRTVDVQFELVTTSSTLPQATTFAHCVTPFYNVTHPLYLVQFVIGMMYWNMLKFISHAVKTHKNDQD